MEGIQKWAVAVCAAAVICTLLRHLFPDNRLGQHGRMLLPCLFLCVLLSPISGELRSVKVPDFTVENIADDQQIVARMRQQMVAHVNDVLLQMANQALSGYGWSAKKVVTDMDIAEDGSIRMGQITLYVDEKVGRSATAVKQVAERRLGTTVEVAVWESVDG